MTFTCFYVQRVKETQRNEALLRIKEDTQHYRSTLQPCYQTQFGLFTMPECPMAKADFSFCTDGNKPKQINFPPAPHSGSQLPWISNAVACSEIKVMARRQGQIKDTQFKVTSSSLRCCLVTLDIYIFHTCYRGWYIDNFSGWGMGPESNRNQRSDWLPLSSPLSRYLTNSHSSAPPALEPK